MVRGRGQESKVRSQKSGCRDRSGSGSGSGEKGQGQGQGQGQGHGAGPYSGTWCRVRASGRDRFKGQASKERIRCMGRDRSRGQD